MTRATTVLRVLASRRSTSRLALFERLYPEGDARDLEDHEGVVAGLELAGLVRIEGDRLELTRAGVAYLEAIESPVDGDAAELLELEGLELRPPAGLDQRPGISSGLRRLLVVLVFLFALLAGILWHACS